MAINTDREMIVGLDIGTSKIVTIVGEIDEDGNIELLGMGSHRSQGLRKALSLTLTAPWTLFRSRWSKPKRLARGVSSPFQSLSHKSSARW